ncbi:MAG TPA: protein-tyrosine-phosphatase [Xanthobacteraceae bacterium]|nr:protein-tyrosine-phosphatase [Xanthobacteraceae bacterium]
MMPLSFSMLTICGLEELTLHGSRGVTHILSILDPGHPEPEAFLAYSQHHRAVLRFHDAIAPAPNIMLPEREHVKAILDFGQSLAQSAGTTGGHLLVHCHAGISRSTAAMATLMAQVAPDRDEEAVFDHLINIRPKAWPNSRMIAFADELLARNGRFAAPLGKLYRRQLAAYPHIRDFMMENGRAHEVRLADAA